MGMSGDNPSREFSIVAETRRRWSEAEKAAIVAEASGPCTNVSAVARRHDIKPPLLFRWMKERTVALAHANPTSFMPVVVSQMTNPGPPAPVTSEQVARSVPSSGACCWMRTTRRKCSQCIRACTLFSAHCRFHPSGPVRFVKCQKLIILPLESHR